MEGSGVKILITGGTGFTGAALAARLSELGNSVISIDYQKGICFGELQEKGVKLMTGSITDASLVENAMQGIDFVFHLAAAFRELDVSNEYYYDVNVEGTRIVIDAAFRCGVKKFVYCSTQGVHGHIANPPGDENSPIAPADYYQETKYGGEAVVQEFIQKGMNATIIRPTAIYGPGDPGRFLMIYKWACRGFFPMFGKGRTFYHPVYIDNLVDAFIELLDFEKGKGGTYIIGDEEYLSIEDLVKKAGKAIGITIKVFHFPLLPLVLAGYAFEKAYKPFNIPPPLFPRRVDWYRQVRAFKIDKAKSELGYQPRIGIDEGLRRTGHWYTHKGYIAD
jgi:nucleoside-diphosphate-sugar epimerase